MSQFPQYFPASGDFSGAFPNPVLQTSLPQFDTAASGVKYPDGTDNKGVWYGTNTKANAFNNTTITLGQNATTLSGNAVAVGTSASVNVMNGVAVGRSAQTNSIPNSIVLNATGSAASPSDASHALAISLNSSSVTPNRIGMTVNGAQREIRAYNNLYQTTATSGSTTVLTATSGLRQFFTGSSNETVQLPDVTTLSLGFEFEVYSKTSGVITITSSGGNTVTTLSGDNGVAFLTCVLLTGTTETSWSVITQNEVVLDNLAEVTWPTDPLTDGIFYGSGTRGNVFGGIAVGNGALTEYIDSVAIGHDASVTGNVGGIAVGRGALASNDNIAFGDAADASDALSFDAIAIGNGATCSGSGSICIGTNAFNAGEECVTIGHNATVVGDHNVAIGQNVVINGSNSVAIGNDSSAVGNCMVIGSSSNTVPESVLISTTSGTKLIRLELPASVTQTTNLNTAVTVDASQGFITLFSTLGSLGTASFTVNDNQCDSGSIIRTTVQSSTACLAHTTSVSAGSFGLRVVNTEASATAAAPIIHFDIYGPA